MSEKSVAEIVTEEIFAINEKKDVQFAFLSGAIRGAGELNFSPYGFILEFRHKNERFITLIADLLLRVYGEEIPIDSSFCYLGYTQDLFYKIVIPQKQSADLLEKCEIVKNKYEIVQGVPKNFLGSSAKRKAYLRGLYLSCGFLKVPEHNDEGTGKKSGGYTLAFNLNSDAATDDVIEVIARESCIEKNVIRKKKNGHGIYLRSSDAIGSVLAAMGCMRGSLLLYEIVAARQVVNNVNRMRNCDMANIDKTVRAGSKQIDAIKLLKSLGLYEQLTDDLKQTCVLRETYPDVGIEQLGELFDPPQTKSCVNHRLRRIEELAKNPEKLEKKAQKATLGRGKRDR